DRLYICPAALLDNHYEYSTAYRNSLAEDSDRTRRSSTSAASAMAGSAPGRNGREAQSAGLDGVAHQRKGSLRYVVRSLGGAVSAARWPSKGAQAENRRGSSAGGVPRSLRSRSHF